VPFDLLPVTILSIPYWTDINTNQITNTDKSGIIALHLTPTIHTHQNNTSKKEERKAIHPSKILNPLFTAISLAFL